MDRGAKKAQSKKLKAAHRRKKREEEKNGGLDDLIAYLDKKETATEAAMAFEYKDEPMVIIPVNVLMKFETLSVNERDKRVFFHNEKTGEAYVACWE